MIEDDIQLIEDILQPWRARLGADYAGYRNHVYRMVNFCFAQGDFDDEARAKIAVAGCFHDLGIWSDETFDYLAPSAALAREYLQASGRSRWTSDVEPMIDWHHQLRPHRDAQRPLVEIFRRGDLVDFSLGAIKCGLPADYVKSVKAHFPNAGFHRRLVRLAAGWFCRHPLNPLPVLRW